MKQRRSATALGAIGGMIGAAMLAGCVNYATYPPTPGSVAIGNPNTPAIEEVMMAGLQWAAMRYPPGPVVTELDEAESPQLVVNLPVGVRGKVYERVAGVVPGAEPLSPGNSHLPIYHIGSIRIRGDTAQLNIFRPVKDLGPMPTGETLYQEVRVDLRGGLSPWRVVGWREWTPGSGQLPDLNYFVPEPPAPRDGPRIGGVYQ